GDDSGKVRGHDRIAGRLGRLHLVKGKRAVGRILNRLAVTVPLIARRRHRVRDTGHERNVVAHRGDNSAVRFRDVDDGRPAKLPVKIHDAARPVEPVRVGDVLQAGTGGNLDKTVTPAGGVGVATQKIATHASGGLNTQRGGELI